MPLSFLCQNLVISVITYDLKLSHDHNVFKWLLRYIIVYVQYNTKYFCYIQ